MNQKIYRIIVSHLNQSKVSSPPIKANHHSKKILKNIHNNQTKNLQHKKFKGKNSSQNASIIKKNYLSNWLFSNLTTALQKKYSATAKKQNA